MPHLLIALVLPTLGACGGGGSPGTVDATATAAAAPATPIAAPNPATPATPATPTTPPATPTSGGDSLQPVTTPSNSTAVGTARALSETASLSLAGVPDAPVSATPVSAASGARLFYVDSRAGDDRNDGRAAATATASGAGPWRTLARVMQSDLGAGDALVLACGSEWRETLRLPASGTAARPILVGAPAGGCTTRPTIDGSVAIAASAWTPHNGNIYKAALDSTPLQVFASTGFFTEAHHPNRGHLASDTTSPYLALAADGNVVTAGGAPGSTTVVTGPDLALPRGATLAPGARLRVRTNSWLMDEARISSVDGNRLTLASATGYPLAAGWGYLLLGQLWMLDSAGEWYYDGSAKQLYAWMPDSAAPSAAVNISVLGVGIDLTSRSHVVIDGLVVRRVGTGLLMRGTTGIALRNSSIEDSADMGADAAFSTAATFESNTFARVGVDAISGQDDNTGPATGMTVRNNLIRDSGVIVQGELALSVPRPAHAAIRSGRSATVTGNVIINSAFVGIRVMGSSLVEDNFIFGACTVLDDCGGIVTWHERDITIRRNTLVHARGSVAGKPATERYTQAQGIYLDEWSTAVLVEDNTVIDTDNGIQIHDAPSNTVRNNRFYANRSSQIWMQETSRAANASGDLFGNVVSGNQIAAVYPGSVGMLLQSLYASTAAFGSFDGNRYYDRASALAAVAATATQTQALTLAQWRQSRNVGSTQTVEAAGTSVSGKGYAGYAVSGANLVPNSALLQGAQGWTTYNANAPLGQLLREPCQPGQCLRYLAGGSAGLVSSPNFSVARGQWYRLTVDLATQQDAQVVQLIVRRGGGGSNGYESLSDGTLTATAGTTFGRYSFIFQANATILAANPATGDLGARVDIVNIEDGKSVSLANMELVAITPDMLAQTSGALINVGSSPLTATCPFVSTQPTLCAKFINLADDQPVTWPMTVAPRSAVILYAQEPTLIDRDGDGIPDAQDRCPGTVAGAVVNAAGCSIAQH